LGVTSNDHHFRTQITLIFMTGMFLILSSACQFLSAGEAVQTTSSVQATVTRQPSQTPAATTSPTLTPAIISADNPITLTFWTVEQISPLSEDELGDFFQTRLSVFEQEHPEIKINALVKKASGKGGVLDFLRTARDVAPSILPDVVVMNATDLNQAYTENLLQSLDGRLDRSIVQDLLPAARRIGTVNEALAGVPLGIELEHTVYNTQVFTTTPLLWTDILSENVTYLFPAKGVNGLVNDATLSQYFSAGGRFINDQGVPEVNERILRQVLDIYQQARDSGVITPDILEAATIGELWPFYLEGRAGVAQINVRQYLTDRELLVETGYAPVPISSRTETPVSVMRGWVLALVTTDVNRQDAALRLIESFLSTSNNATWNRLNKSIPTRDTSFRQLAAEDPYWLFLMDRLNTAQPEPRFLGYDRISRIIQQAIERVIRGEATSEEATATAIDDLTQ
jgi:ABC-type glycerol-3-phosphate transport system substrate-binding protein